MQRVFVDLFCTAQDVPPETFLREMRRLERFASIAPGQRAQYQTDRSALAIARGATEWLENELKQEWRGGAGDIAAGDLLAKLYFETKRWEPLHQLVAAVDARPNLPEQTLYSLALRLAETGHAALALPITERLYQRFPQNAEYVLLRARTLWDSGRRQDATRALEAADAANIFREGASSQAAGLWATLGERGRARLSLEETLARDPFAVRSAPTQVWLATFDLEDHRVDDAYRLLASAYRHPATADMEPLVNALAASGRLEADTGGDLPGGDLPMIFLRRAQLFAAVGERLRRDGHTDEAFSLIRAHPELLTEVPGFAEALRRNATAEQIPALTTLLETAVAGSEFGSPPLARMLAKLLLRSAEDAPTGSADAMNLLTRAHELAPDDFAVSRFLAASFLTQGQSAQAAELLRPYLTEEALPSDRGAARHALG